MVPGVSSRYCAASGVALGSPGARMPRTAPASPGAVPGSCSCAPEPFVDDLAGRADAEPPRRARAFGRPKVHGLPGRDASAGADLVIIKGQGADAYRSYDPVAMTICGHA
jgi:hypothetical protein